MINFHIIEDEKSQFDSIKTNIKNCLEILCIENNFEYSINGTKCWEEDSNSFLNNFVNKDTDVLILDYDLYWGEQNKSFDGDIVLKKILEQKLLKQPFVIFTSSKFDVNKKGIPPAFTNGDFTSASYISIDKYILLDEIFIEKLKEILTISIQSVLKKYPRAYFSHVPYPKEYKETANFLISEIVKQNIEVYTSLIYEDELLGIYYSGKSQKLLGLILEEQEIMFIVIDEGSRPNKIDVFNKLLENEFNSFKLSTKGFSYNSSYFEETSKKTFKLDYNKLGLPRYLKFKNFVNKEIEIINKIKSEKGNERKELIEINPFCDFFFKLEL